MKESFGGQTKQFRLWYH